MITRMPRTKLPHRVYRIFQLPSRPFGQSTLVDPTRRRDTNACGSTTREYVKDM
jgi:hypothetical protein